jgi:hypothetical protein
MSNGDAVRKSPNPLLDAARYFEDLRLMAENQPHQIATLVKSRHSVMVPVGKQDDDRDNDYADDECAYHSHER